MKSVTDPAFIGKMIMVLLIGFIFFFFIFHMSRFGEGNGERQTTSIEQIIRKALVQCYALEGSYPTDLAYIQKYGVIMDNAKYIYFYEWSGSNLMPNIIVLER